jgi:hypothetical protein
MVARDRAFSVAFGVSLLLSPPLKLASAAEVTATLVLAVSTSQFSPPSPDPSGLAYSGLVDRLIIRDGEVEDIPAGYPGSFAGWRYIPLSSCPCLAITAV